MPLLRRHPNRLKGVGFGRRTPTRTYVTTGRHPKPFTIAVIRTTPVETAGLTGRNARHQRVLAHHRVVRIDQPPLRGKDAPAGVDRPGPSASSSRRCGRTRKRPNSMAVRVDGMGSI
jgi:hypothetical protein